MSTDATPENQAGDKVSSQTTVHPTPKSGGPAGTGAKRPAKPKPLLENGLLLIDKTPGGTSHDSVARSRRITRQKKTGHAGTLDPDATGLLVLTLGQATRLTRFLIRAPKVYEGTIRLGAVTDTYDASGQVTAEADPAAVAAVTLDDVRQAMERLTGEIDHIPPAYSAKKVGGKKLYELAREGKEVPRESKKVTIYEFVPLGDLEPAEGETPPEKESPARADVRFRLGCASGTYARTLAHDVGEALGTGAHLAALRRTQVGPFQLADAALLDEVEVALEAGETPRGWLPFDDIPLPFGEIVTDAQQEQRLNHGQTVLVRDLHGEEGDWVKLVGRSGRFLAVGSIVEVIGTGGAGIVQPRVVFH